ncbi:MAG: KpsF/GutQ family sugar-phosphate isomerase [Acidobacteria bacterium]|nr:KpsF/GutQ family sugar-phosphate isomerase [Acidobacteriota bacterium]MBI3654984.1 KpsF/GutQ family sugar-phosphate isomerase [Acidobacteriota bacterium]
MILESARRILGIEAEAIRELIGRLDDRFERAVRLLYDCRGRVVTTGMGKSGIICKKIAATLASTGTPALFLHPAEAVHGDLGMVAKGDVVLALSNSGETTEIMALIERLKRLNIPVISFVGSLTSPLARASDISLDVGVRQEACSLGLAPSASTTASLALGDALALALSELRGFKEEDFATLHPGGSLSRKFLRLREAMHTGAAIPKVHADTGMRDVIYEMSNKGFGLTSVVTDHDVLVGIITDGDLRRFWQRHSNILEKTAAEVMTKNPVTIADDELAAKALALMEERKITALLITDSHGVLEGIVHLHDLWRTQMV